MSTKIQNQRKVLGLSQEEVAESLGISRPTYNKIEEGIIKPNPLQTEILKNIFNTKEDLSVAENKFVKDEVSVRKIPKENVQKFEAIFIYLLNKVGNRPNIGQTDIYKLLYFIEFDYYEKFEEQIIGATYIKNTYGPTPISFPKVMANLKRIGKVVEVKSKYFGKDQVRYLATCEADLSCLSGNEIGHIDREIDRLSHMSALQLSELSHKDTPWSVAADKAIINYEHVFYRPKETSVRQYEEL